MAVIEQGVGIVCPCGGDYRVSDSRPSFTAIRRRRVCLSCRKRITTFELVVPDGLEVEDLILGASMSSKVDKLKILLASAIQEAIAKVSL